MRTLTSKTNDAVRVTLSPDSKEISEKMKQSAEKENAIETEIDLNTDSDETPLADEAKTLEDCSSIENKTDTDSSSESDEIETDAIEQENETMDESESDESESDDPETALKKKDKELKDLQDRLLRLSAEFENFKKRNRREMSDFKKFAAEVLIKDLLPAVDNLDRALETTSTVEACKAISDGVTMTRDEIIKVFTKYGVQSIEALEKPFDPAFHQAVGQEESEDSPENTILKEYQKGYTMHGRLLRPSMVIVSK